MYNLAGDNHCDKRIEKELHRADVEIIRHDKPLSQEVPASLTGKLGDKFTFTRAWYYWVVNGPVPLNVAEEIYENPNGRKDVRVAGHCGCPPPSDWERDGFINTYHIDSQEGLNMFVQTLRRHNLARTQKESIMNKVVDYKVVRCHGKRDERQLPEFEDKVKDLISSGWEPFGNLHTETDRMGFTTYTQAMVKRSRPKPENKYRRFGVPQ